MLFLIMNDNKNCCISSQNVHIWLDNRMNLQDAIQSGAVFVVSDCSRGRNNDITRCVNGFKIVWKETRDSRQNSLRRRAAVNSTCVEALNTPPPPSVRDRRFRRAQKPFHYDQRSGTLKWNRYTDSEHRLNAFMAVVKAVYDGRTAVRYWHAADWPRDGGHVRKLSHRLPYPGGPLSTVWKLARLKVAAYLITV